MSRDEFNMIVFRLQLATAVPDMKFFVLNKQESDTTLNTALKLTIQG
jgi:hypothetical protein